VHYEYGRLTLATAGLLLYQKTAYINLLCRPTAQVQVVYNDYTPFKLYSRFSLC